MKPGACCSSEGLQRMKGQTHELSWLRKRKHSKESEWHEKDPERREGAGWGHMGLSPREKSGLQRLVITLSEFFRPWESVPPARQNVWRRRGLMMETPGYRRGRR